MRSKNKKVNDEELEIQDELEDEEDSESSEEASNPKEEEKGKQIPKQAVNFDNKWIKENVTDEKIAGLLKSKREADAAGDKVTARKIRRALREAGFYVSKNRED